MPQRLGRRGPLARVDTQQAPDQIKKPGGRVRDPVTHARLFRDQQLKQLAAPPGGSGTARAAAAAARSDGCGDALVQVPRLGVEAVGVAPPADHPVRDGAEDAFQARQERRHGVIL